MCVIPGSTVTPGSPHTTIRLPQYQPVIFRQVINYIYTGKVVLELISSILEWSEKESVSLEISCRMDIIRAGRVSGKIFENLHI